MTTVKVIAIPEANKTGSRGRRAPPETALHRPRLTCGSWTAWQSSTGIILSGAQTVAELS